jgi:excisionase family DNA binding protein
VSEYRCEIDAISGPWREGSMGVQEAAAFPGLGRTRLLEMAYEGTLPTTKVGRRRLFARRGLVELLRKAANEVVG